MPSYRGRGPAMSLRFSGAWRFPRLPVLWHPETVDPGLCANCVHSQVMRSDRGSTFLRCLLSEKDPRFPKYPRLPVLSCAGWTKKPKS